jgi:5'(3')-deoxyribonucleotidase
MRIGLDLDGVVANWERTAKDWLNYHRGTKLNLEEVSTSWHSIQESVSKEDWEWLWGDAIKMGLFAELEVFDGAQTFVRGLTQLGDITILTSRPVHRISFIDTQLWWNENGFPPVFNWNFFDCGLKKTNVRTDVFIEDNIDNAKVYAVAWGDSQVILLDRPYNQGDLGYPVVGESAWAPVRAHDYDEILSIVAGVSTT